MAEPTSPVQSQEPQEQQQAPKKKPYKPPELKCLGTIAELTRGQASPTIPGMPPGIPHP